MNTSIQTVIFAIFFKILNLLHVSVMNKLNYIHVKTIKYLFCNKYVLQILTYKCVLAKNIYVKLDDFRKFQ